MSAIDAARPATWGTLAALHRLVLRTQVSLTRLLGIAALSGLAILIGVFARYADDPTQAAVDGIASYGLAILVPLAALWLGTSALGDLVEDRLLVYLWLKPVPRWQLPAAAVLATVAIVVPLTALPVTVSAFAAGTPSLAWQAFLSAALGALAYSGLFVLAGLWFRRAVWWGLAFILIWENLLANTVDGAARFTVAGWTGAVLGLAAGGADHIDAGSPAVAFVVLPAIAVAAWLLAVWRYRRADVD
jgi:ABC-2 type transport system permease protein